MNNEGEEKILELGVGIVYNPIIEPLLEDSYDLVTVLEIEPQTLWRYSPTQKQPYKKVETTIERLKNLPQRKIVHGVGFPVGGSILPDMRHITPLMEVIEDLKANWASEHLSFNVASDTNGNFNTGFLLPPLLTEAGVEAAVKSIRKIATQLPVPFAVETGVNYLKPIPGELSDGAFVAAVSNAASCDILLDLHNIWSNECNGRQKVRDFLAEIPLERVLEVHLAGGMNYEGYWLDAHSGIIPEPLLDLANRVIPALPNLRAIIFEILPSFIPQLGLDGIREQLRKLNQIWEKRYSKSDYDLSTKTLEQPSSSGKIELNKFDINNVSPSIWEKALGSLVIDRECTEPLANKLAEDPGVGIIRKLVWNFRAGMIVSNLKLSCRLLMLSKGDEFFQQLLNDFFSTHSPEIFASSEAQAFSDYLGKIELNVKYLTEVLAFELAAINSLIEDKEQTINLSYDPTLLLQPLTQGYLPSEVPKGNFQIQVI